MNAFLLFYNAVYQCYTFRNIAGLRKKKQSD